MGKDSNITVRYCNQDLMSTELTGFRMTLASESWEQAELGLKLLRHSAAAHGLSLNIVLWMELTQQDCHSIGVILTPNDAGGELKH